VADASGVEQGDPLHKGAERLAARLIDDIAAGGWQVGLVLGTEPQLTERYGVSRGTFREAVRLLEHLGVARTREGRSGGLMVTEPQARALTDAAAAYLRYQQVDIKELYEARRKLELDVLDLVLAQADGPAKTMLRTAVERETAQEFEGILSWRDGLHGALATIAGNRALAMFLDTLMSLSSEYSRLQGGGAGDAAELLRESHRAHAAIARAIAAGNRDLARARMTTHLYAVERWMTNWPTSRSQEIKDDA
jgi:DNA-binding FadR family transcriptional regulator